MLENMLKNPLIGILASVITTIALVIATVAGFVASGSSSKDNDRYVANYIGIPEEAKPASPEQIDHILASTWLPSPSYENTPIGFKPTEGKYAVTGKVCNGFGVFVAPDRATGTYSTTTGLVTKMGCNQRAHDYEEAIATAFERGDTFYVESADVIYTGKNGKGLMLTRATAAAAK